MKYLCREFFDRTTAQLPRPNITVALLEFSHYKYIYMKPNSMDRRKFIHNTIATAAATVSLNLFTNNAQAAPAEKPFNAKFAPHDGMFKNSGGATFIDQIKYMHDMGFRAVEDNGMLTRPKEEQEKIGSLLTQLGMTM